MPPLPVSEFKPRLPGIIQLLQTFVELESPTSDKPAVDVLGRRVADEMEQLGAQVTSYPQDQAGDHWLGRWGEGTQGILLLAHLDTVHPLGSLTKIPFKRESGCLHGPGVLDMKSGLVIALEAIRALIEHGRMPSGPVSLLCTSDEETGSLTSREIIVDLAREHRLTLCLEPALPDGSLKTHRSGIGVIEVETIGRAAHAGADPKSGINAILEITHQIQSLANLADHAAGTTICASVIAGGTRVNVVPERCQAQVDVRVKSNAEKERIDQALRELSPMLEGAHVSALCDWNRPPMPRTAVVAQAFEQAKQLAADLGLSLSEGGTGGGSDANFVAPLGMPLLDGLGAVGSGAHSEREHVLEGELAPRTALLAALLSEW